MALLAIACIAAQFGGSLVASLASLVVWLVALAVVDAALLRRFWMPRFWLLTAIVALAGGLLLGRRDVEILRVPFSSEGLRLGALMVIRGAFVFGLALWASRALAGSGWRRWTRRLGAEPLGAAVSVAFGLLPGLEAEWSRARAAAGRSGGRRFRRTFDASVELIARTARLAERLALEQSGGADALETGPSADRPLRLAVVGPRGAGKTSTLGRLADALRGKGRSVGGIRQPRVLDGDRTVGYRLEDVADGTVREFASESSTSDAAGSRFRFDPEGWAWAAERIRRARREAEIVVVDELGRLEARGEGHLPALLEEVESPRARVLLIAVREDAARAVSGRLGGFDRVLPADASVGEIEAEAERLVARLVAEADGPPSLHR
jgi:nucleoside-triphosphatase THEP1